MKKTIIALALTTALSQAAVYKVNNGTGAAANGIGNSSGVAFQGSAAVFSFGYFNKTDSEIPTLNASQLVAAFVNYSTTNSYANFTNAGPTGAKGTVTSSLARNPSTDFANKNIYVFVGNASSIGSATEFLVLKTTLTFDTADSVALEQNKVFTAANSTLLVGSNVSDLKTTTADASTTPGWLTAAAVPEPSTTLLGAFGALALLRRRRN